MADHVNNPILRKIYDLKGDPDETRASYKDWAATYDTDTTKGMGYVAPGIAAGALADRVAPSARILDAGCGTGLAGRELAARGMTRIDGFDLSPEMLEQARGKKIYGALWEVDMTQPLDVPDSTYDGVISVGVFTSGHVPPRALDALARVTRSGGPIVVTVHELVWEKEGYPAHLAEMEARGLISVESTDPAPYHEKEGLTCRLCILRAA